MHNHEEEKGLRKPSISLAFVTQRKQSWSFVKTLTLQAGSM